MSAVVSPSNSEQHTLLYRVIAGRHVVYGYFHCKSLMHMRVQTRCQDIVVATMKNMTSTNKAMITGAIVAAGEPPENPSVPTML